MGEDLLTDAVDGAGQGDELGVVVDRGVRAWPAAGLVEAGALGGHGRQHVLGRAGGHAQPIARKRRRSRRSSSAAWPGERVRSSRLPTAATSSDPATATGCGSGTGRPSRRARHSA